MGIGNFFEKGIPKIIGGPYQPPVQPTQPQAQVGLPLIIQQLYGGAEFTPGADTMEAGFKTSPGFRPGSPMNINMPSTFAPGYGSSINNPGIRTADFRDSDGDGIDDRDQIGPGQPRVQSPGFSFGNTFGLGTMAQTTLADLSAFNPIANQYALAGFTVGEILAMPEFSGGTATSAGLANLEAQLRETGSKGPEDRGSYRDRFGTAEDQGFGFTGGTGTFQNPALGTFGDKFTPGPGIGKAYDEFGRLRDIGNVDDLGLNLANLVGPFAKAPIGITGAVSKVADVFKNFREKQKEAEAKAKAEEAKAIAEENKKLADEIKKQIKDREKKKKDKEAKAQTTGTGFKTAKATDTATGKFSGSPKGDGSKGNFGGPSGHGSGKQGGKHGPAGGQKGKNKGTSRF